MTYVSSWGRRDFSRMTAVWNCGSLPPSHVVGEKLIAEEMRAEGILSKSGRRYAPPHKACPSNILCPKSLSGNENVAISTHIWMEWSYSIFLLFILGKFISITNQLRSCEFINFQPGRFFFFFFTFSLGNRYIYVTHSTSVWLVSKKGW